VRKAAAHYPFGAGEEGKRERLKGGWGEVRKPDGTVDQTITPT
jgi:hypothetical protein